ncbi:hypothetical protein BpHYR1_019834 [Brachionus plicatilis]|uniref:Uncharacterized protein n=1 Tax=Brachionus plicatilis TaxID=10195 RepID=A0A3M7QRC6_BRAPC|nr:hypothetical protein BpHYR1_019834 [Brachionus plicatilis]
MEIHFLLKSWPDRGSKQKSACILYRYKKLHMAKIIALTLQFFHEFSHELKKHHRIKHST